ncbi:helix-turn-helix domain-containing protein [Primorskyibacter sp. 2E107]|uniref:helix-turn-helix domain-containing protein n=1 Tax=Primorskyibacter sp. 2E107 TaxID=3403458 RepID=UPI003AF5518A
MATIAEQRVFTPVLRRQLVHALGTAAESLGLKGKDLPVLLALLSFIKTKGTGSSAEISPGQLLCVFASNAAIVDRCQVTVDERSVRRSIDRFCQLGLAVRRDSNNGKRFPRYQNGVLVAAFGIDMSPLIYKAEEIYALAKRATHEAATIRALRSEARQLCNKAISTISDVDVVNWFAEAGRIIRRKISLEALIDIRDEIVKKLWESMSSDEQVEDAHEEISSGDIKKSSNSDEPQEVNTAPLPVSAGQDVRQRKKRTENKNNYEAQNTTHQDIWNSISEVRSFYEEAPTSFSSLARRLIDFSTLLGMKPNVVAAALGRNNLQVVATILNDIATRIIEIPSPTSAFFDGLNNSPNFVGSEQPQ